MIGHMGTPFLLVLFFFFCELGSALGHCAVGGFAGITTQAMLATWEPEPNTRQQPGQPQRVVNVR